ncbi:MAG: hypothetical protein A3C70_00655 [Candidatus Zambryskibacteria bacterium RIFCSPHIGHO2_02_FULL_43_14]|uniref:Uncharacterized protein n=1 Tax=Candidatus Zambryskibacteria bacterium RIFCSPHIGHO2_02_FULL_43_14 TaxID=1802748 RepID=A0A1G2TDY8_9BACT|nr:MAG: hypothetical protein A2829_02700 [Candidatus Zambryskibacteria bacterium RIFCSPHIGHO2_01_FULL_43_60]OHA95525.1 MAG: hypothetical protein A3C70_00655 [Candidatus Zambryskibacteria bacterium RIFCSPHIGHO2_02_FULL_43_14]
MTEETWKTGWKPEYAGLPFRVIVFASFFGPKPDQTTLELLEEVQRLSDSEMSELFASAFKAFQAMN